MTKHTKSIISNEPMCLICGTPYDLHRHHIFSGSGRRSKSEKWGCWCYLCANHHNMSDFSVHHNHELDLMVRQIGQKAWEERFGTREEFIKIFGRSWLEE